MAPKYAVPCSVFLLMVATVSFVVADQSEFMAPKPEEFISTEGGRVEIISEKFQQMKDAGFGAAMVSVEPDSMTMPMYADAPALKYVLQGQAMAGLVSPMGMSTNVWCIMEGDVVAVPRGWSWWIWNNHTEALKMMAVVHTKETWNTFFLMGAQKEQTGGIIHGFSKETLARAWNVNEDDVEKLRSGAKETTFVKVPKEDAEKLTWESSSPLLGDFVYNVKNSDGEIVVKNGGTVRQMNSMKLPILRSMGMSLCRVHLEAGAMMAPHFVNGAQMIHFTNGNGKMEMAYPDGRSAFQMDMKMGDTVVVPPMFPVTMIAKEDDTLSWVTFSNTDMEMPAFLAGFNSLYHALPRTVVKNGFNVPDDILDKAYYTRRSRYEIGIFPPQGKEVPVATL